MKPYIVLYWDDASRPADEPLAFECQADDNDHAEEQCADAYPGCTVAWVFLGSAVDDAYCDYWSFL